MTRDKDPAFDTVDVSGDSTIAGKPFSPSDPPASESQAVSGDAHVVQTGGDWSDVVTKIENNDYVILKGNISHNNSSDTVNIAPGTHKYVDASGAVIQCRGKMIRRTRNPGGFFDGSFNWYGGQFEGTQSSGEIPFHLTDALGDHIFPHRIRDCEIGVAVDNDERWSEIFSVGFRGRNNLCAVAVVGTDNDNNNTGGSYPSGASLSGPPDDTDGTYSFRNFYCDVWASPRQPDNGWTTSYGIWTDTAKPYTGNFERVSVNVDTDIVGLRMHENFEAARIHFWSETPGSKQNGTAIVVDEMVRSPNWIGGHIVTAGGTTKVAGAESKPLGIEMAEKTGSGGARFWNRFEVDGSTVSAWIDEGSGNYRKEFESNYRQRYKRNGNSGSPTVEVGGNGAGLYISGGDLYAVDENGNTNNLTP